MLHGYEAVHVGIAPQAPSGLMVPAVRHAEARNLWGLAAELQRLSKVARDGKAARDGRSGRAR
jgi:2-oxoisovalerate dehydrogenase E2 component (dihydrolipoyl transacylase)